MPNPGLALLNWMPAEAASCQALPHPQGWLSSVSHTRTRAGWGVSQAAEQWPAGRMRGWALGQRPGTRFRRPTLQQRHPTSVPCSSGSLVLCWRNWDSPVVRTGLSFHPLLSSFPHDFTVDLDVLGREERWQQWEGQPETSACVIQTLPTPAEVNTALGCVPIEGLGFLAQSSSASVFPSVNQEW